jgi:hypothetical protein
MGQPQMQAKQNMPKNSSAVSKPEKTNPKTQN